MRKIRIVVVGLNFGLNLLKQEILNGVASKYVEVVGVCDLNKDLCHEICLEYNLRHYEDLDSILDDASVDAVALFTGPKNRSILIDKIISSGKHVMTTKPFDLDVNQALKVLIKARELKRVVHMNSPTPIPSPETAMIIEWPKEFNLGRLISLHWETYVSYDEEADGSWYDDSEKCPVAPVFRLGIYGLNDIIQICGPVSQVGILSSRIRTGRPTPDNANLSLLFKNGAVGSVQASFCIQNGSDYPNSLTLNYERGTIRSRPVISGHNTAKTCFKEVSLQTLDKYGHLIQKSAQFGIEELSGKYYWKLFQQSILGSTVLENEVTPEQIIAPMQIILAMAEAEKTGRNVSIKPVVI